MGSKLRYTVQGQDRGTLGLMGFIEHDAFTFLKKKYKSNVNIQLLLLERRATVSYKLNLFRG